MSKRVLFHLLSLLQFPIAILWKKNIVAFVQTHSYFEYIYYFYFTLREIDDDQRVIAKGRPILINN